MLKNLRLPIILVCALLFAVQGRADDTLRDLFRQMPDSILPTLSQNNRLDMIDFIDSGMEARVNNLLGGQSQLTALTDDSLSLRMSDALTVDMLLLCSPQTDASASDTTVVDSIAYIICLASTYGTDSLARQTTFAFYSEAWRRLSNCPPLSEADRQRIKRLEVQTILKWEREILNKD